MSVGGNAMAGFHVAHTVYLASKDMRAQESFRKPILHLAYRFECLVVSDFGEPTRTLFSLTHCSRQLKDDLPSLPHFAQRHPSRQAEPSANTRGELSDAFPACLSLSGPVHSIPSRLVEKITVCFRHRQASGAKTSHGKRQKRQYVNSNYCAVSLIICC
ncbi:hypothetical protein ASPBRDRAFT_572471 [Aspergillus brasiliensis CBS 101740]|uniref:Uncharacterized protein n=1 Tax=Aspergillus brasiliensis (strain CBS 101740 / IMI 381727 / IBT 21946) TaxID=767769 RepID=A0A1L9UJ72_ASPBC|nr:hypothetical protein ASPBRDRAFT_572471 [Aspergillus brasiliensis CBS 101740]